MKIRILEHQVAGNMLGVLSAGVLRSTKYSKTPPRQSIWRGFLRGNCNKTGWLYLLIAST